MNEHETSRVKNGIGAGAEFKCNIHWLLLAKVLINTPVFRLLMNHLLIFCEGVLPELCFGRRKARRLQYATNERDELHDCMIVCLYSTWKKTNTLPCLPGMKR
jgi:hypothetical protein